MREMPATRLRPPAHLPGATEFSAERDVLAPLWFVKTLKQTAWLSRELEETTRLDKGHGRRKEPGFWALAYLAFVVSDSVDLEPWWAKTGQEIWRECGFPARPPYPTVYERFVELEGASEAFTAIAAKLIQHCRKHDANIGAHVHVDGSESETHAALVHECQPGSGCEWHSSGASQKQQKRARAAKRPKRVPTELVRAERQKEAERAPEPDEKLDLGVEEVRELPDGRKRVKINGHWYGTRDSTAGIRAYTGKRRANKFWHGFYNIKGIDHYTGAPLAIGVYSASQNEHLCYPDLLARIQTALGENPQTIVADKGFSRTDVFALNTSQGIASVIPWRKVNQHEKRHDHETHDRHGIPRCKHCGAPSTFVRFRAALNGKGPRLYFRCELQATPACASEQSISCSKDWRLLVPLWRTEAAYHELEASHGNYEHVHHHLRDRWLVGGDTLANRPRRIGRDWQELRAQAALVAEWLVIAWREGWLDSARRNRKTATNRAARGRDAAESLIRYRAGKGLGLPYGPRAFLLGIGLPDPPSKRAKAPPGPAPPPDDGGDSIPF
jgi:Transposase DDE domain